MQDSDFIKSLKERYLDPVDAQKSDFSKEELLESMLDQEEEIEMFKPTTSEIRKMSDEVKSPTDFERMLGVISP